MLYGYAAWFRARALFIAYVDVIFAICLLRHALRHTPLEELRATRDHRAFDYAAAAMVAKGRDATPLMPRRFIAELIRH